MSAYKEIYQRWMQKKELDPTLKEELLALSDSKDIEDRFYRHLQFGTGGLRGIIGAGTNRINLYTIRRATEGLARYINKRGCSAKEKGVAIAYDSRQLSSEFAAATASVLAYHGIRVYLFKELRPTPMLSFAVRHLETTAGIVITASHNPPEYNGYKVYWEDGGQLPPSIADAVLSEINTVDNELTVEYMDFNEARQQGLIHILDEQIDEEYSKCLLSLSLRPDIIKKVANDFRVVYTPLHGTGNKPVRRILEKMGLKYIYVVPEQEHPDPFFSTVSSPNPEELQAFNLAIELAKQVDADIILGTDPDADRVGIIAKNKRGEYVNLNGNQTGALLLYYLLEHKIMIPPNAVVIKTIVTSELGRAIAAEAGVKTVDSLTGFKFIGEKISEYEKTKEFSFLFGYEESYGYLVGNFVRDKDAVQASMFACEMAAYYKSLGLTLHEVLETIYQKYGYYVEDLVSYTFFGKEGEEKISSIMNNLRSRSLETIGKLTVFEIKDYAKGIDDLPKSNVLKFILQDKSWVAVRPSGTEPKIKFYFSAIDQNKELAEKKLITLKKFVMGLVI